MMRNALAVSCALLLGFLFSGCVSIPPSKPLINHAVWESVTRDHVFESCLKALHIQGHMISATDKSLGIIGTNWVSFREGVVNASPFSAVVKFQGRDIR